MEILIKEKKALLRRIFPISLCSTTEEIGEVGTYLTFWNYARSIVERIFHFEGLSIICDSKKLKFNSK